MINQSRSFLKNYHQIGRDMIQKMVFWEFYRFVQINKTPLIHFLFNLMFRVQLLNYLNKIVRMNCIDNFLNMIKNFASLMSNPNSSKKSIFNKSGGFSLNLTLSRTHL